MHTSSECSTYLELMWDMGLSAWKYKEPSRNSTLLASHAKEVLLLSQVSRLSTRELGSILGTSVLDRYHAHELPKLRNEIGEKRPVRRRRLPKLPILGKFGLESPFERFKRLRLVKGKKAGYMLEMEDRDSIYRHPWASSLLYIPLSTLILPRMPHTAQIKMGVFILRSVMIKSAVMEGYDNCEFQQLEGVAAKDGSLRPGC